jgi:hypothetical protein
VEAHVLPHHCSTRVAEWGAPASKRGATPERLTASLGWLEGGDDSVDATLCRWQALVSGRKHRSAVVAAIDTAVALRGALHTSTGPMGDGDWQAWVTTGKLRWTKRDRLVIDKRWCRVRDDALPLPPRHPRRQKTDSSPAKQPTMNCCFQLFAFISFSSGRWARCIFSIVSVTGSGRKYIASRSPSAEWAALHSVSTFASAGHHRHLGARSCCCCRAETWRWAAKYGGATNL